MTFNDKIYGRNGLFDFIPNRVSASTCRIVYSYILRLLAGLEEKTSV